MTHTPELTLQAPQEESQPAETWLSVTFSLSYCSPDIRVLNRPTGSYSKAAILAGSWMQLSSPEKRGARLAWPAHFAETRRGAGLTGLVLEHVENNSIHGSLSCSTG